MNLIACSSFTLFPLHVVLAAYFAQATPRTAANRLFALVNALIAIWALAHGFYVLAPDKQTAWFYHHIATAAWLITAPTIFHFLLELSASWGKSRFRSGFAPLAYAPVPAALLRLYRGGSLLDYDIVYGRYGWYERSHVFAPWAIYVQVFSWLLVLGAMVVVFVRARSSPRKIERLQGYTISISGIASLIAVIAYASVLPEIVPDFNVTTLTPMTTAFWIFGMWHAIFRYGLLRISPAIAAENILETMAEPLVITDDEYHVVRVNAALESLLGLPAAQLLKRPLGELLSGSSIEPEEWLRRLDHEALHHLELQFNRPDGRPAALVVSGTKVADRRRISSGYVIIMRDVTALKHAEDRLRHLATHDPLTELPNRILFKDRAEQAIARAQRTRTRVAMLMLDLNGFKPINDTYGHEAGDEVLRQVAGRCKRTLRATDTIARLGGDEFVALLTDLNQPEDARVAIQRLEFAVVQPIQVEHRTLSVGVSIGMGMYPEQGEDVDTLMKVADSAMYVVKQGTKAAESTTMRQATPLALGTRDLMGGLPQALERKELELFYQTLHKATDGSVVGIEALLRWNHPDYGTIGPLSFVPLAERSGLIVPIGNWVMRQACTQNKTWQSTGIVRVPVAVNVSIKQLIRTDFAATVRTILEETRLEPTHLQIEISEAAALQDIRAVKTALLALHALGVRVVIDDFGSGYAELCRLSELSVHAVKINQFLIRNMVVEQRDRTAVRAIISMASAFGIQAIAKGVETEGQLELLRNLAWEQAPAPTCGTIQGFVFSRPSTARELSNALSETSAAAATC